MPYFGTYPGPYVPQPLLIRSVTPGTDLQTADTDILILALRTATRYDYNM